MPTEIAKAYVQIIPTTKGIKGQLTSELGGEANSAGESAGQSFGSKFASMAKKAIAAAGIGKFIRSTIDASADYEQLAGGVKKLFGDNAEEIMQFAQQAYKTAGMSANDYMETVTGFSAALISSLGGDTEAAVSYANMAITDMSDNANTFGTDIESIQNAYQGFAKQNFTMLDNLKLGYGGTKEEMQRLIDKANEIRVQQGLNADLTIDSYADIVEAIHLVQDEMAILGTTANEAAGTYSGSLASMKGAFENFQASLGSGENLQSSLGSLVETAKTYLESNLLPMLTTILGSLPTSLLTAVTELAPTVIQTGADTLNNMVTGLTNSMPTLIPAAVTAIETIATGLADNIPTLLLSAAGLMEALASGLMETIPTVVEKVPEIVNGITTKFSELFPQLVTTGVSLLVSIIENMPEIISQITGQLPQIITGIVDRLIDNIPVIAQAGVDLLVALVGNLPQIIMSIVGVVPEIMNSLKDTFFARFEEMRQVGLYLFEGLKSGIADKIKNIAEEVYAWASDFIAGIKSFFGIHSPSTVFAGIGENLMLGLQEGLEDAQPAVKKAMDEINGMTTDKMNSTIALSTAGVDSIISSNATISTRSVSDDVSNDIFDGVYRGMLNAMKSADFGGEFNFYLEGEKLVSYVSKKQRQSARAMGV